MTIERDELAAIISQPEKVDHGPLSCGPNSTFAGRVADAIIAAGYRKSRTITTAEELDALPVGSIVLDGDPDALLKIHGGNWRSLLDPEQPYGSGYLALPVTVLYESVEP